MSTLTMKDIARLAGVSESTVSRTLNNKPGVSQKTRELIRSLVFQHGFSPNLLARGLAQKKSGIIGLILPDITNYYTTPIVRSIEDECIKNGFHLLLGNSDGRMEREKSYVSFFEASRVDGIIFLAGGLAEDTILKLGLKNFPLFLVNRLSEELPLPTVLIDYRQGGFLATDHLLQCGHSNVALVMGPSDRMENEDILAGYRLALTKHRRPYCSRLVVETDGSRGGGYRAFLRLVAAPPTAIFAAGDLLALGVADAIKTGGYIIPHDFALVGWEDNLITSLIDPPLTTVAPPYRLLGTRAVNKLVGLIGGAKLDEPVEILSPELLVGCSTKMKGCV